MIETKELDAYCIFGRSYARKCEASAILRLFGHRSGRAACIILRFQRARER